MKWKELQYNHKGYLHHPDTPHDDVLFYHEQKDKIQDLSRIGIEFIQKDGAALRRLAEHSKEELGVNSKNIHRGAYCPSPVLDLLFTNSKRGRISSKVYSGSHITERYRYDHTGKLSYVDNYHNGVIVSSEYLVYQKNCTYGITIGSNGRLVSISEEVYDNNQLKSYIVVCLFGELDRLECYRAYCERYHYDQKGLVLWDHYRIEYGWEKIAPSGFIEHKRYLLERENGYLVRFFAVLSDGSVDKSRYLDVSGKKRKAR